VDKIANFEEEFEQHSITKNKKLIESIKIAERISQKVSTYEGTFKINPGFRLYRREK